MYVKRVCESNLHSLEEGCDDCLKQKRYGPASGILSKALYTHVKVIVSEQICGKHRQAGGMADAGAGEEDEWEDEGGWEDESPHKVWNPTRHSFLAVAGCISRRLVQERGRSWKDLPNDWVVNVKEDAGVYRVIYTSPDGAVNLMLTLYLLGFEAHAKWAVILPRPMTWEGLLWRMCQNAAAQDSSVVWSIRLRHSRSRCCVTRAKFASTFRARRWTLTLSRLRTFHSVLRV
jgi:hypothetical protein